MIVLLFVDLVLRILRKLPFNRGFICLHRPVIFIYVIGYFSIVNSFHSIAHDFITNEFQTVNDGYFGMRSFIFKNDDAKTNFYEACLFEFVIYIVLLIISLCCIRWMKTGNTFANSIHNFRLIFVLTFGFMMLGRISYVWGYYVGSSKKNTEDLISFVFAILFVVCMIIELVFLLVTAFAESKLTYLIYYDNKGRVVDKENNVIAEVLHSCIHKDLKTAFMDYSNADHDPVSRVYNIAWIWRWFLAWMIYTIFQEDSSAINLVIMVLHIVWLVFTCYAAFMRRGIFFSKLIGIVMTIEDALVVGLSACCLLHSFNQGGSDNSKNMLELLKVLIFFGAIVCEVVLILLGMLCSMGRKDVLYMR